jgi:hypothetical protein
MSRDSYDRSVFPVDEGVTPRYTATLVADDGLTAIPGSTLTSLTLTLYVEDGELTIVNSRNNQNVLQTGGVTVDEDGALVWSATVGDTTILNDTLPFERHVALFQWTWGTGRAGKHEIVLSVRNLARVP